MPIRRLRVRVIGAHEDVAKLGRMLSKHAIVHDAGGFVVRRGRPEDVLLIVVTGSRGESWPEVSRARETRTPIVVVVLGESSVLPDSLAEFDYCVARSLLSPGTDAAIIDMVRDAGRGAKVQPWVFADARDRIRYATVVAVAVLGLRGYIISASTWRKFGVDDPYDGVSDIIIKSAELGIQSLAFDEWQVSKVALLANAVTVLLIPVLVAYVRGLEALHAPRPFRRLPSWPLLRRFLQHRGPVVVLASSAAVMGCLWILYAGASNIGSRRAEQQIWDAICTEAVAMPQRSRSATRLREEVLRVAGTATKSEALPELLPSREFDSAMPQMQWHVPSRIFVLKSGASESIYARAWLVELADRWPADPSMWSTGPDEPVAIAVVAVHRVPVFGYGRLPSPHTARVELWPKVAEEYPRACVDRLMERMRVHRVAGESPACRRCCLHGEPGP